MCEDCIHMGCKKIHSKVHWGSTTPPHVTMLSQMEGRRRKFDALRADIKGDMQEMMDKRGVVGL